MTELLVASRKGLFVLEGEPGGPFQTTARAFAGDPVEYALRDERSGRLLASVTSPFHGPKIFYTDDPAGEWQPARGVALPKGGDEALAKVWLLTAGEDGGTLYAGGDPGVLFESRDGGESFEINRGLWEQPSRTSWQAGGGGLCVHSIVPWPDDPDRLAVAISAAGVWLTDDRGKTWRRGNKGMRARYMPEGMEEQTDDLCVHHVERARKQPERLFMQFHGGVYRSDDGGETWKDIAAGLPGDFAFPLAVDPADPDSAYVIPLNAETDRVTAGGRVEVWETRDAGATWTPCGEGLPQDAYLTVLRLAFTTRSQGPSLELYFGATSGDVYGSADAGASWFSVAEHLPPVNSLSAS